MKKLKQKFARGGAILAALLAIATTPHIRAGQFQLNLANLKTKGAALCSKAFQYKGKLFAACSTVVVGATYLKNKRDYKAILDRCNEAVPRWQEDYNRQQERVDYLKKQELQTKQEYINSMEKAAQLAQAKPPMNDAAAQHAYEKVCAQEWANIQLAPIRYKDTRNAIQKELNLENGALRSIRAQLERARYTAYAVNRQTNTSLLLYPGALMTGRPVIENMHIHGNSMIIGACAFAVLLTVIKSALTSFVLIKGTHLAKNVGSWFNLCNSTQLSEPTKLLIKRSTLALCTLHEIKKFIAMPSNVLSIVEQTASAVARNRQHGQLGNVDQNFEAFIRALQPGAEVGNPAGDIPTVTRLNPALEEHNNQ